MPFKLPVDDGGAGRQPVPPFTRQPLRWAIPPRKGVPGSVSVPPGANEPETIDPLTVSLSTISFGDRETGIIGVALPNLARVATINFSQPTIIISVSLASSVANASGTNPVILVVTKDQGPILSITSGYDFMVEHIVEQGLSHSQRSGTSYTENIAPSFGTSDRMALYALSLAAANAFTAIVTIRYLSQV